jgi:hypothetical protein
MVSYPPSERQVNGRPGAVNGHARPEKTPAGTPRKDVRLVKERAVQLPELRDYVRPPSWMHECAC